MIHHSESQYKSLPFPSKFIDMSPLAGIIKASIFASLKFFLPSLPPFFFFFLATPTEFSPQVSLWQQVQPRLRFRGGSLWHLPSQHWHSVLSGPNLSKYFLEKYGWYASSKTAHSRLCCSAPVPGLQGQQNPLCCCASPIPGLSVPEISFILCPSSPKEVQTLGLFCSRKSFFCASPLPLCSMASKGECWFRRGLTLLLNRAEQIKSFLQCPHQGIDWSFFTLGNYVRQAFWIFLWS